MMLPVPEKRKAELERLRRLQPLESDPFDGVHGVLCNYHIEYLCTSVPEQSRMLFPFDPEQLHPAGYKLHVGNEYYLGGEFYYLPSYPDAPDSARTQRLVIPPFDVVVIKTVETLCLPRFVIARWNLVVKRAYSGLLWVGAAQVDPGFTGHLFCPIYNLSDKCVPLEEGEDIALVDFVKTTPFDRQKSICWKLQEKVILEDYVKDGLKSALVTHAQDRLEDIGKRMKDMETSVKSNVDSIDTRLTTFTTFMIGALAIIPAIIAAVLPFREVMTFTVSLWAPTAIGFSTFAFASALLRWLSDRKWWPPRPALWLASVLALIVFAVTFLSTHSLNREFIEAKERRGSEVDELAAQLRMMQDDVAGLSLSTASWQRQAEKERELLAERLLMNIEQLERRLSDLTGSRSPLEPGEEGD